MEIDINVRKAVYSANTFQRYWTNVLMFKSISGNHQIIALTNTFVRLVESSVIEYELGADRLREFWDSQGSIPMGAMNRSISHFETCLSGVHRATQCFRRLRRHRQQDPLSVFLNQKPAEFATEVNFKRVRDMRNSIHHLEDALINGEVKQGQSIALRADGPETPHPTIPGQTIKTIDRLEIAGLELSFVELSSVLSQMHDCVETIVVYSLSEGASPGA